MELYKTLNNEALDEDLKAQREVIERLRRQIKDIDENVVSKVELTKEKKIALTKYVLSLNASIDDIFLKSADTRIKEKYNLGDIPYKYNLLATYIMKNLGYKILDDTDKSIVNESVDKLLPKLQSLQELAYQLNFLDAFLVPRIIDNIQFRQFNTLIDLPEIQQKISTFTGIKQKQAPIPAPKQPQVVPKVTPKGRPRLYETPEQAKQAKLEQQRIRRQQAKQAQKQQAEFVKQEVEAEEPEEGEEEPEEVDEDYEMIKASIRETKDELKTLKAQKSQLNKEEYKASKAQLEAYIADLEEQLAEYE
jgi:hypothetical protein